MSIFVLSHIRGSYELTDTVEIQPFTYKCLGSFANTARCYSNANQYVEYCLVCKTWSFVQQLKVGIDISGVVSSNSKAREAKHNR